MANIGIVVELSNDDNKRRDLVLHHYRGKIDDNLTPLYQSWAEKYEKVRTSTFSKKARQVPKPQRLIFTLIIQVVFSKVNQHIPFHEIREHYSGKIVPKAPKKWKIKT